MSVAPQQPDATVAAEAAAAAPTPFRAGIRLRLVLLVLALGLPFLVYVGLSAVRQRADDRSEARERMISLARLAAARVDDYVSDMEGVVALSSHGTVVDPAQAAANDAFLRGLRRDLPASMSNIGVWALDGRNVGSLDPMQRGADLNIADQPYFAETLAHRGVTIDAPLPARSDGAPIAIFARPLLDATDRPRGVVTASARLAGLTGLLDARGVAPAPTIVTLVNRAGIILARNRDAAHWIGRRFADAGEAPGAAQMSESADQRRGADGVLRVVAYATPSRAPWRVYVERPPTQSSRRRAWGWPKRSCWDCRRCSSASYSPSTREPGSPARCASWRPMPRALAEVTFRTGRASAAATSSASSRGR